MTDLEIQLIAILRQLFTNPHTHPGDHIYDVRESEGLDWDGPSVKAWGEACKKAEAMLETFKDI